MRVYSVADLKKVTEIFARMFYDPQSKVFSVFAETVVDFVGVHADDLSHWLPILLPRLFLKLVSDLRGSIHTKVQQALQAVRSLPVSLFVYIFIFCYFASFYIIFVILVNSCHP